MRLVLLTLVSVFVWVSFQISFRSIAMHYTVNIPIDLIVWTVEGVIITIVIILLMKAMRREV